MHISEGVLSAPVLITGAVLTAVGVGIGLKKMDYEKIPEVAVLTSAFFVASLIHIPIGPSSVHLILNGLIGLLLGWSAFPAILVGLALQAILFQFGGFTSLGGKEKHMVITLPGQEAFLVALSLVSTGDAFLAVARLIVIAHLPVMIIEGLITATAVGFLNKVRPELLAGKGG